MMSCRIGQGAIRRALNPALRATSTSLTHRFSSALSTASDEAVYQPDARHIHKSSKVYQGKVKAVVLDWAGTVLDCGVYSPAVVFIEVFKEFGVPISMEEAREPMGRHKKVHIRLITKMPSVRKRWKEAHGSYPTEKDVEAMFARFVPLQIGCLDKYTDMITGAVDTVNELQTNRGLKIGSTTGFTTPMVDVLAKAASKNGYNPDAIVCADEVPQARPYPFMVWENLLRLDVSPIASCVKVDDTCDGVMEGISAGCWSVGLAKTGNYVGLNEQEIKGLEPEEYSYLMDRSYAKLSESGAHYVIDDITSLPEVIDDINRRLALGEKP